MAQRNEILIGLGPRRPESKRKCHESDTGTHVKTPQALPFLNQNDGQGTKIRLTLEGGRSGLASRRKSGQKPRQRRRGRVAEGNGLLNRHTCYSVSRVRIPASPPANSLILLDKETCGM